MQARGQRVPALENQPELDRIDAWNLRACSDLAADRDTAGALPWRVCNEYASAHGLTVDEAAELFTVLRAGLTQLSEWRDEQRKKAEDKKTLGNG